MRRRSFVSVAASGILALAMAVVPVAIHAQSGATIIKPEAMKSLMPSEVFYRGQMASTQLRNAYGIKFANGYYVLTSLVDTSGYSSGVAAKYQAYFITEVPIHINGMRLGAGAYGIGFIAGNKFIVTDVGGHDVFTVHSSMDNAIAHPRPLEVRAEPGGKFRLYIGRDYVDLSR